MNAVPKVEGYMLVKTDISVVFPAPLGPSNPNISFFSIEKVFGFRARISVPSLIYVFDN
jgi:hypothetical protein